MAKIVDSNIQSRTISSSYSVWRVALIGVVLGFTHWCITVLIGRYTNSTIISGDIATILVATLGLIVMVRLFMARPIVIALASAVSLWGLAQWTRGLSWGEVIAWNVLLYCLAYTLYSWISRYTRIVPVLIVIITIVALIRITTTL